MNLSGGQSKANVNFPLTVTSTHIAVSISGIPANTDLNVFAMNPGSQGPSLVRAIPYAGATASVNLPALNGSYQVGVGPSVNTDPSAGTSATPTLTFLPPFPQPANVSGSSVSVSFALQSATNLIKAKVVDASGNGIANAFVMVRSQSGQSGDDSGGQTASGGFVSIPTVAGDYTLTANVPGSGPSAPVSVEVQNNVSNADGNTTADVYENGTLITAGNPLLLTIAQGSITISGKVLDQNGNPIPYANVRAELQNGSNFGGQFVGAPTDAAGSYTLYVSAGTWILHAFAPGFGDIGSTTVTITTQSASKNLQASSANFGTISGTVKQNGVGVVGAFVNAYGTSGGNQGTTGSGGVYSMNVTAGTYTIQGFVPGSGPTNTLTSVAVSGGQTVSGQNLTLAQNGTIAVTISGVTDAFVEARDASGLGNGTNTNTSGVYTITVPAGTYTVRAGSPRLGNIGQQASVVVTGGATANVTFTPATSYNISGVISSSSTACVSGVGVAFSDSTHGRVTVAMTSATGSYAVNLPSGTYQVLAGKPGCVDNAAPSTITVAGAAQTGVNRTVNAASSTIIGTVSLNGSAVTVPTKVIGKSSDGKYVFADVNTTNGTYTLNVPGGTTWTVSARSDGNTSGTSVASAGGSANLTLSAIAGYTQTAPGSSQVTPTVGGVVKNANIGGNFAVNIPASALSTSDTTASTITTSTTTAFANQTPTATVVGTTAVQVTPTDSNGQAISTLNSNATISIPYTDADLTAAGVTDATKLVVGVWDDTTQTWAPLSTTVDTTNKVLTAVTPHFSTFATVVPTGGGTTTTTTTTTTTATTSGGGGGGGGGGSGARQYVMTHADTAGNTGIPATTMLAAQFTVLNTKDLKSIGNHLQISLGNKTVVFRDVTLDAWFAAPVATVLQAGIASGYKDAQGNPTGQFGPSNNITYGEIAKMSLQSARQSSVNGLPANRTARGDWSSPYVRTAENLGLSVYLGNPDVHQPATRGAVIQTLMEVIGMKDAPPASSSSMSSLSSAVSSMNRASASSSVNTLGAMSSLSSVSSSSSSVSSASSASSISSSSSSSAPIAFTDLSMSNPYAKAILLFAKLGIVTGDTDTSGQPTGSVRPNAPINRAEVAKIFSKLIELGYVR